MTQADAGIVQLRWLRSLAWIASSWLLLAALTWFLAGVVPETVRSRPQLSVALQNQLMAWEMILLAGVVGSIGIALFVFSALVRGFVSAGGVRFFRWVVVATVVLVGALYGASWVTFISGSRFLDPAMAEFLLMSPQQFMQHAVHIDPARTLLSPVLIVVPALVLAWGVPWLLDRIHFAGHVLLVVAAGVALSYAFSLSPGQPSADRASALLGADFRPHRPVVAPAGLVYSYGDLLEISRDERSGPVSAIAAVVRDRLWSGPASPEAEPSISVVRRPIVAIEEWASGVDRRKLKRLNVIVAVVESLRSDQLQVFGGSREVMPTVEALAQEGLGFSNHYTQASHSNYADPAILSSHYPLRSKQVHVYPENPTYPRVMIYDVLKALGWHTAVISSQNENWGQMINFLKTGSVDHFFHSETFDGPTYVPRNDTGFARFMKGSKRSGKIDDRFTIDEAIHWIGSLPEDDPFFIYLNLQNSHLPYETPADFPRRFGPEAISFKIRFNGFPRSETQTVKDIYADSLAYSDHQLGRLVAYLKEEGLWEQTLLVVTGDTGQAFYEHGLVAHASMVFNEVMRVPLVIRAPNTAPLVDSRPAQHIDIPPTILDLLGLPPHPGFQGLSLLDPSPDPQRSRFLVAQTPLAHQYAIVKGDQKLIYDVRRDSVMLSNLALDPGETSSRAEEEPQAVSELLARLQTWRRHQLDYYGDIGLHRRVYPPVLED